MSVKEDKSISASRLALVGIVSVWVSIELVSHAFRFMDTNHRMEGLLDGECVYQVSTDNFILGTRSFVNSRSLGDLLKSFDAVTIGEQELTNRIVPCNTLVNIDTKDGAVAFSSIPGTQLIALGKKVSINDSTTQDLEAVPGIGPRMAERIVDYRSSHGRFKSVRDLEKVQGIGQKRLLELESYLKP